MKVQSDRKTNPDHFSPAFPTKLSWVAVSLTQAIRAAIYAGLEAGLATGNLTPNLILWQRRAGQ
jgi:hypothetical protein